MDDENLDEIKISVTRAASLLMVSDQWVRDLAKKGYIEKTDRGSVPLVAAVQGYIRWLKDEDRRSSKVAAATDVQRQRAKEIELRIARESGKLIDLEDAEMAFANILGTFRSELAGVPASSTRDLSIRDTIDRNINDAMARARDRFRQYRESLAKPASTVPAQQIDQVESTGASEPAG